MGDNETISETAAALAEDRTVDSITAKYGDLWAETRLKARRASESVVRILEYPMPRSPDQREALYQVLASAVYDEMMRSADAN